MVASPTLATALPLEALVWEDASARVWPSDNAASYLKSRHEVSGREEAVSALDRALDSIPDKALE